MIMVTHNINIAEMANTVIKVSDGKIAEVYKMMCVNLHLK